jgi:transposase-like protein
VDQDGVVLDILVQERRGAKASKRLFRNLLKAQQYVPRVIVTGSRGVTAWRSASCFPLSSIGKVDI